MPGRQSIDEFPWTMYRDVIRNFLIANVGVHIVHDFPIYQDDDSVERFRRKFVPEPPAETLLNAWMVRRVSQTAEWFTQESMTVQATAMLHGWYEIDNELRSRDTFDSLIDTVMGLFWRNLTLLDEVKAVHPAQLVTSEARFFADRLVHYCEITALIEQEVFISQVI